MLQNAPRRVWFWTWQALYAEGMEEMLEQYFPGMPLPELHCEGGGIVFSIHIDVSFRFTLLQNGDEFMEQRLVKMCTDEFKLRY